jgi:hypothetical protein
MPSRQPEDRITGPQVTNLQDALQQLQTAAGDLGNGDTAENLRAFGKAVTLTGAAGEDLLTHLKPPAANQSGTKKAKCIQLHLEEVNVFGPAHRGFLMRRSAFRT